MKVEIRTEPRGVCFSKISIGSCFKHDSRYYVKTDKQGLAVHLASGSCKIFEDRNEIVPCTDAKVVIE